MSGIEIKEAFDNLNLYKNNICYDFKIDDMVFNNMGIFINYKYELIKDIMYSIKNYYINQLNTKINLEEDKFIFISNIYKESIDKLYTYILSTHKKIEELKTIVNNKIIRLINKPLDYIIYELNWCNEELLLPKMLNINRLINNDINLEIIINDIYEQEIYNIISYKLPNLSIEMEDELLHFVETPDIVYITMKEIVNKIIEDLKYNSTKMEALRNLFSHKIYQYINMYKNIDDMKLAQLYNCLNIKNVKFIIDMNDYNVVWIMKKLYMITDKFIPASLVDIKLNDIVNHNINDNIVMIKYNKDATTSSQYTKYLIDKLYNTLMEIEIKNL